MYLEINLTLGRQRFFPEVAIKLLSIFKPSHKIEASNCNCWLTFSIFLESPFLNDQLNSGFHLLSVSLRRLQYGRQAGGIHVKVCQFHPQHMPMRPKVQVWLIPRKPPILGFQHVSEIRTFCYILSKQIKGLSVSYFSAVCNFFQKHLLLVHKYPAGLNYYSKFRIDVA